ncbi:RNA 2',3'-cyclic phosphodiesterase [Rhodohalobacter sulfatireducens]|uniref:RNA 2',3'-cyclic phosphodiesterase n=1 Tax=Rhodohalobacter sulfatireducens TaxID=2911366 RepID=A0ABS9KAI0_9BACT|nr:RNA 2',3'-cyclic phosphodiesterase [Rhodohalobacter sulfatireducens]MCG2587850.1 RNA 2',3'-cyclic phosphodiesterase [Rhodohalobacter sulfatireducens]
MRLFVSIDFPESTREEILSWIPDQEGWKKVLKNQLHLTLVFIGECSEAEKDKIHRKLSEIEFTPFNLKISGLGAFPNESSPRIIWAGVTQNDSIMNLQKRIADRLEDHIKSKNNNSYIPHITLARKKSRKGANRVFKTNLKKDTGQLVENVDSFQLKQSFLKSSGSEHQTLHRYS